MDIVSVVSDGIPVCKILAKNPPRSVVARKKIIAYMAYRESTEPVRLKDIAEVLSISKTNTSYVSRMISQVADLRRVSREYHEQLLRYESKLMERVKSCNL